MKRKIKITNCLFIVILVSSVFLSSEILKVSSAQGSLRSPADGSYIADNTPTLKWWLNSGVSKYNIQMSKVDNFLVTIVDEELNHPTNEYTVGPPQSDGVYYFRVREFYIYTLTWSDWSDVWEFIIDTINPTKPHPYIPFDETHINDPTPKLIWSTSDDINFDYYEIIVDDSASMSSPERTITIAYRLVDSVDITPALSDGCWYWRMRAFDKAERSSGWSDIYSFILDTIPPSGITTLLSPENNSFIMDRTPFFNWTDVVEAYAYQFVISYNPDFDPYYYYYYTLDSHYFCTETLSDGKWYWMVRLMDQVYNLGSCSDVWSFTVDSVEPDTPALLSPSNDSTIIERNLLFTWSSISDAEEYQIQVDNTSNAFTSVVIDYYANDTEYLEEELFNNVECTYYWHVRARDAAGNWGAWSDVWSFYANTIPPAQPILSEPFNGNISSIVKPILMWETIPGVEEYRIQLSTLDTFTFTIINTTTTSNYYMVITALSDDVYFWRVKARNFAGNWGAWSIVWTYIVDTTAPEIAGPDDFSYVEGSIGNEITWSITETNYPLVYEIYKDGLLINSSTLEFPENTLNIFCDGLIIGDYNFTLIVFDPAGNRVQDEVLITVIEAVNEFIPIISLIPIITLLGFTWIFKNRNRKEV